MPRREREWLCWTKPSGIPCSPQASAQAPTPAATPESSPTASAEESPTAGESEGAEGGEDYPLAVATVKDGQTLTGKLLGEEFDIAIADGSVKGDEVRFTVTTTNYYSGGKTIFQYTGTVKGTELVSTAMLTIA